MMDVPLPMQVYDFERRYRDIEPKNVFDVWSTIHTRLDYANGMWQPEKSQPAEEAISWSSSPVCALWFANRSARGTRLVSAKANPE